jgi:N-methylhydantoinase A
MYRISIDVGGTFTDLVAIDEDNGKIINIKTLSSPKAPEKGVIKAIQEFLKINDPSSVSMIGHATTIATNAMFGQIDLVLPKTGFITTSGFKDLIEIGRQRRADVYNLFFVRPPPLVKRRHRYEIIERIAASGEVEYPLDTYELKEILKRIEIDGIESIAVGFLNSYANNLHEEIVLKYLKQNSDIFITASHEISNEYREYERFSTAVVNAILMPVINTYITNLEFFIDKLSLNSPLYVMQSNGGLSKSNIVSQKPATIVESGPAAGVIAASWLGEQIGIKNIISFDMGGTTAKAGVIRGKIPEVVPEYEVAGKIHLGRLIKGSGYPVRFPFIDLAECSAGGGTIAKMVNGTLMVGPTSSGAIPGPACYGMGGTEATITDANLVLGRLNPRSLLDGEMKIYPQKAKKVYLALGKSLGLSSFESAVSVIQIANSIMSKILRMVSIERGYDPREFILVAFGGAGPMHICALANQLEISRIVIPPNPGMFSALGLLTADLFHDYSRPVMLEITNVDVEQVERKFSEMEIQGQSILKEEGIMEKYHKFIRTFDMRYKGQGFELNIPTNSVFNKRHLERAVKMFHNKHREVYGFAEEDEPVEIVNAKLRAIGFLKSPKLIEKKLHENSKPRETRSVYFENIEKWCEVEVFNRNILDSAKEGPAIVEQYDSTSVIYPSWRFKPDEYGNLLLWRKDN